MVGLVQAADPIGDCRCTTPGLGHHWTIPESAAYMPGGCLLGGAASSKGFPSWSGWSRLEDQALRRAQIRDYCAGYPLIGAAALLRFRMLLWSRGHGIEVPAILPQVEAH